MKDIVNWRNTIIGKLCEHKENSPERHAFTYLPGGDAAEVCVTFKDLHDEAQAIAVYIRRLVSPGDKVILCYPPGLEYVTAFFGCLFAGVIAVPVYPPQSKASINRFSGVMKDCKAKYILSCRSLQEQFWSSMCDNYGFKPDQCVVTDQIAGIDTTNFNWPDISTDLLAFFQYTSGSTGDPKGVMISHGNIVANLKSLREATRCSEKDVFVNWLPLFHDLGLVNTMLLPVYLGSHSVLMSPIAFVANPRCWLEAITRFKGSIGGGPNFCYDLCLAKIKESKLLGLDLSSWRIAFNAAEPIHNRTIEAFAERFSAVGFKREATYPSYGMAEATVYLTGRSYDAGLSSTVSEQAKRVVACGKPTSDHDIAIVKPGSAIRLPDNELGEIWASGPSIAKGYWGREEINETIFRARIEEDVSGRTWLKTGDLGFQKKGELYITGRIKELIIIRGQNYYPTDIERTVQESHKDLRVGGGAAFSVEDDDGEQLVIVQEVGRTALKSLNPNEIYQAVLASVADEYQLDVCAILLVKPGQIDKTTSGKIQRRLCKQKYFEEKIDTIAIYKRSLNDEDSFVEASTPEEIMIHSIISDELGVSRLGVNKNFFSMGANSIHLTRALLRINEAANVDLSIQTIFEYPSIESLSEYIKSRKDRNLDNVEIATSISKVPKNSKIPLSQPQKGLWFIWKYEGAIPAYNEVNAFSLDQSIDVYAIESSFRKLAERHEILRSVVQEIDGEPYLEVSDNYELNFKHEVVADHKELKRRLRKEAEYPFNLYEDQLIRVRLLEYNRSYLLLVCMHHIIIDGWSVNILVSELNAFYNAIITCQDDSLSPLKLQYIDYAAWNKKLIPDDADIDYWRNHLKGMPALHSLRTDFRRPDQQKFHGRKVFHNFDNELTSKINNFCSHYQVSLFIFFQAAFSILLSRYGNEADIVIGSPVSGRSRIELKDLIGYFVNTLVFRNEVSLSESFTDFLARVKSNSIDAYRHQSVPFDLLVNELQPSRTTAYNPLVQIALVLQNDVFTELNLGGSVCEKVDVWESEIFTKYDLELAITESTSGLDVEWKYNTDLFAEKTIKRYMKSFSALIDNILTGPESTIADINYLAPEDKKIVLNSASKPSENAQARTLHRVFEEAVRLYPTHTAIVCENNKVSYSDLNRYANRLARHLLHHGVEAGDIVGLYFDRSIEMIIAIMAVLKAGATYLPIDPSNPTERTQYILDDSKIHVVLTNLMVSGGILSDAQRAIHISAANIETEYRCYSTDNLDGDLVTPENTAYIIYTSGSTGLPKGVKVTHRNVTRLFSTSEQIYNFNDTDVWTLFHSYAFDFSVWELFGALLYGGKLIVVPYWVSRDPEQFAQLIKQESVSVLNQTPSAFDQLISADATQSQESLTSLRYIIFGGEAIEYSTVRPWFSRYRSAPTRLFNMYGITETTVHVTYYEILPNDKYLMQSSIIGRPLPDLAVYVLDTHYKPVPAGVAGEIYVAGPGLAQGYLNRNQLTSERFLDNPYSSDAAYSTMYRTGDLARYNEDGVLEYLGRSDQQVKIRGHRIELGEIETTLGRHSLVASAVVLVDDSKQTKQLSAYIVPKADSSGKLDKKLLADDVDDYLARYLPAYMIPNALFVIDEIPLTNNGKLDKKALLSVKTNYSLIAEYSEPVDYVEEVLCESWAEVLDVRQVGTSDNFFTLGGDSIIAIQAVAKAKKRGIEFSVRDLFRFQTIGKLKNHVKQVEISTSARQEPIVGELELLPMQRYFFDRELASPHHYNQSILVDVAGGMSFDNCKEIVQLLLERHDGLRLTFGLGSDVPNGYFVPFNSSMLDSCVYYNDARTVPTETRMEYINGVLELTNKSFDLKKKPLFKVVYFDTADEKKTLALIAHHLIIDGVSWRIILSDVQLAWRQLKNAEPMKLPQKTASLQEWSEMIRHYSRTEKLLSLEKEYWLNVLVSGQDAEPSKTKPDCGLYTYTSTKTLSLDGSQTSVLLNECNGAYNTTVNELLIACTVRALMSWKSLNRICMDLEGHGREPLGYDLDVSETVGWFTSIYPVNLNFDNDSNLPDVIKQTKEFIRGMPENGAGYMVLKHIARDPQIHQMADERRAMVLFNYLGSLESVSRIDSDVKLVEDAVLLSSDTSNKPTHPIEINVYHALDRLHFRINFNSEEYAGEASIFLRHLTHAISECVTHCSTTRRQFTPSDFPCLELDQCTIDEIVPQLEEATGSRVSNIYPLSSTQEEIMFHGLFNAQSSAYFEQVSFKLKKELDPTCWQQAWRDVFYKHDILKTEFHHNLLDIPVQVVYERPEFVWNSINFQSQSYVKAMEIIEMNKEQQRQAGFQFSKAPLTSFFLYELKDGSYYFVWSFHHILLDGWSMSLVIRDVLQCYSGGSERYATQPSAAVPYADYIAWTLASDEVEVSDFWREYLADYRKPIELAFEKRESTLVDDKGELDEVDNKRVYFDFDNKDYQQLKGLVAREGVTLNAIIHAAFALTLMRYSGTDDIVFGETTSGRPTDLVRVDEMVGLFIHSVPVRYKIDRQKVLLDWTRSVSAACVEREEYGYLPLARIKQASVVEGDFIFRHLLNVENYPIDMKEIDRSEILTLDAISHYAINSFPFTMVVIPHESLSAYVSFDPNIFEDGDITEFLDAFGMVMNVYISNPNVTIDEVLSALMAAHKEKTEAKLKEIKSIRKLGGKRKEIEFG